MVKENGRDDWKSHFNYISNNKTKNKQKSHTHVSFSSRECNQLWISSESLLICVKAEFKSAAQAEGETEGL